MCGCSLGLEHIDVDENHMGSEEAAGAAQLDTAGRWISRTASGEWDQNHAGKITPNPPNSIPEPPHPLTVGVRPVPLFLVECMVKDGTSDYVSF